MAITQIYTAQAGDTITADRWNNEFGGIIDNGTDVAFPLTKAVSFAGFTITWDASGNTTMVSSGSAGLAFAPGNKTGTPSTTGGVFNSAASTFTDSATAGSGTATAWAAWAIQRPTLAATNASVTTTDAATLYIANSPAEGTNNTLTNEWGLWQDAGASRFDGNMWVQGELVANPNPWRFTATVAAAALTITLQDVNGNTPTASSPVPITFRNATLTTPAMATVLATAATTVVVPSGGALGFTADLLSRIYVVALNNAGTIELAVYHPYNPTGPTLVGLNEAALNTSTTIGTGSDSAQVLYSTTGRTNVAIRVLGYIDITTGAVPGEWDNEDTVIQMMGPGVKRTGDTVQLVVASSGAVATGTTTVPVDDTIPQITEGDLWLTATVTPSAINLLEFTSQIITASSSAGKNVMSLHQASINDALTSSYLSGIASDVARYNGIRWLQRAGVSVSTAYTIRSGEQAGTTTLNGEGGARENGGVMNSFLMVQEIFV